MKNTALTFVAAAALALLGCSDSDHIAAGTRGNDGAAAEPAAQPAPETMDVQVYFTRDERPRAVSRRVPSTDAALSAALGELVRGPTADEQAAALTSFFSPATAGMLREVSLEENGRAVIDFADFSRIIPNASTSAGSAMLLGELNSTVFQFREVRSVEYRFEGSCDAFWNWLQRSCEAVERP